MNKINKYIPISCLFFDRLQDWATRKVIVEIVFLDEDSKAVTSNTRILDFFTKNGEEFIVFENGDKFRLDQLISVNGHSVSG